MPPSLSGARPVAGGRLYPPEGSALGDIEPPLTYEIWALPDAGGVIVDGWVEVYFQPDAPPVRLSQSALAGLNDAAAARFGATDVRELGVGLRDGDLSVAVRQEWHLGLILALMLTVASVATVAVLAVRSRRQAALFRTIARHEITSREAERTRVAREIHDGPLQDIAALARSDGSSAPLLRGISAELRALAAGLRPPSLEEFGLGAALEDLAERHAVATPPLLVRVDVETPPGARLPDDVELAVYRIIQEALTNAVGRGQATTAWVVVRQKPGDLTVVVRDDGQGLPQGVTADRRGTSTLVAEGHFGLAGMRERAQALGGTLAVTAGPGGLGAEVRLTLPVPAVVPAPL